MLEMQFAEPLAQRRDRQFLFFVLVCYTPFIPQETLGPRSRPAWAIPGLGQGSQRTWCLHTVLANINIFEFGADNEK